MFTKRISALATMFASLVLGVTGVACSQSMPASPKLEKKWKNSSVFDLEAISIEVRQLPWWKPMVGHPDGSHSKDFDGAY